ncbi:anti-sigma factor antagonist [Marinomonas piezotolerans]|uniref:Anti-sigma factor antagonist n=1 Tax=Marinomonas piezotolerans TaxID=2213058 RepID=A0A370UDW4_9GAMM|nr:STAS domain-containing protein [Marinomonas piezotolerans]RDL45941.1 anti-sigma factor antagonist [Marinomonas piezotolerans]
MSISVSVEDNKGIVEIAVIGSFDFSLFNDFRLAYTDFIDQYDHFVVNMENVEYLDSAALGMLLSMKAALSSEARIEIIKANDFIRNILMISRFDKRFEIS